MKHLKFFGFLIVCSTLSAFAEEEKIELYPDKYDDIDVNAVLLNDRLRNQYYHCIMDSGPCVTEVSRVMKELLPEAVVTKCRRCTKKQREAFDQIVVWFAENEPDHLDSMARKIVGDFQKKSSAKKKSE